MCIRDSLHHGIFRLCKPNDDLCDSGIDDLPLTHGAGGSIFHIFAGFRVLARQVEGCLLYTSKKVLSEDEIDVLVTLRDGDCAAEAYGCDPTYEYVKITGDYRT